MIPRDARIERSCKDAKREANKARRSREKRSNKTENRAHKAGEFEAFHLTDGARR